MTAGEKLRALRKQRGESAEDLGEIIGVSATAIYYYEHNERRPRDPVKVKIAQHYGVKVEDIFFTSKSDNQ